MSGANDSTIGTETTNGKYFQWGENVAWDYDGGALSTDNCTWDRDTQSCGLSALSAWPSTVSDVTSGGVNRWYDWSTTDNRGPCAPNYHVPTRHEWNAAYTTFGSNRNTFVSTLKLPMAGSRSTSGGSLFSQGSNSYYWSSSPFGAFSFSLYFDSSAVGVGTGVRPVGFSVRCLKN